MVRVTLEGRTFDCESGETVLDTLLRHGVEIPHSCRKGTCGTCLMRSESGDLPKRAQANLRETLRAQRYFHACQCVPTGDMHIARRHGASRSRATVLSHEMVSPTVCRLRLRLPESFTYQAGQSILVHRPDGLVRSYSLASVPHLDDSAELHVRVYEQGRMSRWLRESVTPGDSLDIQGAFGDCIYLPGSPDTPMLMIATGTGLAPLLGIARDALSQSHRGRIVLYHGVRHAADSYGRDALKTLQAEHANLEVVQCVSGSEVPPGFVAGRADDAAFARFEDLSGWRVFLCGSPAMVNSAKKKAYLAGARLDDICTDAFEVAPPPPGAQ
jgi:CDP-4-dehydro-6-deoxyglucose reductase